MQTTAAHSSQPQTARVYSLFHACSHTDSAPKRNLNGAALVLSDGRELPITEAMIQTALEELLR